MDSLEEVKEELAFSMKAFGESNLKLSKANDQAFALKIDNEKLIAMTNELYKINAQLKTELNALERSNRIVNDLYRNACEVNMRLSGETEGMKK